MSNPYRNTRLAPPRLRLLFFATLMVLAPLSVAEPFSLAINNGRVIDPETGTDAVRHIGIIGDRIKLLSEEPLTASKVIDATGLVVSPGFIDLHTHSPTPLGQHYQLLDGVTTALELEAGTYPVGAYAAQISDKPLVNFGASAGYLTMRLLEKDGIAAPDPTGTPMPVGLKGWTTAVRFLFNDFLTTLERTFTEQATKEELQTLSAMLHQGLDEGGLGIGLPLDYISEAVSAEELQMIFEVAAKRDAPLFIHIRRGINGDPAGLREVLSLAKTAGSSIHICHISHNAMRNIELFLEEVRQARAQGVDVTIEVLPYNAGSTTISAAVFSRDWQTIFGISYEDVEWAATGMRFTESSWNEYRDKHPTGNVIHHYLKEAWTLRAIQEPGSIIVSDLLAMESRDVKVPPHNGAFSKILGRYVREQQALTLSTAISKMTLLPARRLENYAPLFKRKGRIQPGMDADITIFNPNTIKDNATYQAPYQQATGIEHVIVNGVHLVDQGKLVDNTFPGRRLLSGQAASGSQATAPHMTP